MIPTLGVGISYNSGLDSLLAQRSDLFQVVEIEPQTFWVNTRKGRKPFRVHAGMIEHLASLPGHKLIHSVAAPVGGTVPADKAQFQLLREMVTYFNAPYLSEHLSFNQAHGYHTGFFLPPRQTKAGVKVAVDAIHRLQDAIGVPIAIETGVNYFQTLPDEMPDGAFVAEVAEAAGCGILLDLHNIYTNARNGRQSVLDFASYLPLDRVWEIHLAGGFERDGFYLDSHSGEMDADLLEVSAQVIRQLPNLKALIYEIFPSFIEVAGIQCVEKQMETLHALWSLRGSVTPSERVVYQTESLQKPLFTPQQWENNIAALVNHHTDTTQAPALLREAACVPLIKGLIEEFRGSMLVGLFPLTSRLLMLMLGQEIFRSLLESFWQRHAPEQYAFNEASQFATFLRETNLEIPSLLATLQFEEATMLTLADGKARTIRFDFDPLPLLRSLAVGQLPDTDAALGDYAITLTGEGVEMQASLSGLQLAAH
jgi:uncharacterized protein